MQFIRSNRLASLATITSLGTCCLALPAHALDPGDVFLAVQDATIVTGFVASGGGFTVPVQVFTGQFGDTGTPNFTPNPGFDCLAGTFTVGTKLGFNILEPLQVWDGASFVAADGEELLISFLGLSAMTGPGFVPGFELAVQANGGFHRHYNMTLLGAGGGTPSPGAYLLVRDLYSTDALLAPSEPIYFVLGYQVPATVVDEAAAWLEAQLAPPEEAHFDVWLRLVDNGGGPSGLVTGAISEGAPGEPIAESWRVFPAELGEDEQFPFSAVEPGIQLLASEETANQALQVDFAGALQRWTGAGFAPAAESMLLAFGPSSAVSGAGPSTGFQFSANSQGFIHSHFEHTLLGAGGADPEPGIYLLPLTIAGVAPVLAPTPTFYECFNLGMSEEEHESACAYADLFVACTVDLSGDGVVDGADLGALLANFGVEGDGGTPGDLDRNGVVDGADLGLLLGAWNWVCPG